MKRLRYSAFLLLIAGLTWVMMPHTSQAQVGILGGFNYENLDDISGAENGEGGTFDSAAGYHLGVTFNRDFTVFGARLSGVYRRVGEYEFGGVAGVASETATLHAIEVPLDVKYRLTLPIATPYVMAGPQLAFPFSDNDDFSDGLEDAYLAGNIGAGVELSAFGVRLTPELRYQFGVTSLVGDDFDVGGVSFSGDDDINMSTVSLRLHIFL